MKKGQRHWGFLFALVPTLIALGTPARAQPFNCVQKKWARTSDAPESGIYTYEGQGRILLVGSGTSQLAGNLWTDVTPSGPAPGGGTGIAYAPARNKVIVVKIDPIYPSNSGTWEWDTLLGGWTAFPGVPTFDLGQLPNDATTPRWLAFPSFVYEGNGKILAFGGEVEYEYPLYVPNYIDQDITWEWDGLSWNMVSPSNSSPPGRFGQAMAYDSVRDTVVLYGGNSEGVGTRSDIWEWDRATSTWTEKHPTGTAPTPATGYSMTYASACGEVVLSGGDVSLPGSGGRSEVWHWNGSRWQLIDNSWTGGAYVGTTYDEVEDRVVALVYDQSPVQTWELAAQCVAPPVGMVAWWPLDETSGLLGSDLIGGSDGSYVGHPTPIDGEVAKGLRLTNAGDFVQVPSAPALDFGTGSITVDAWIRTSDTSASDRTIVGKRGGTDAFPQGYLLGIQQGLLLFQLGDGAAFSGNHWASRPPLTDGQWHHVAAVGDRSGPTGVVTLYVDGAVVPLSTTNVVRMGSVTNAAPLLIGQRNADFGQTNAFDGDIDEVELFDRALTGPEISGIATAGSAGKCKSRLITKVIPALDEWGLGLLIFLLGSMGAFLAARPRLRVGGADAELLEMARDETRHRLEEDHQ